MPLTFSFIDDQLDVGDNKRIDAYVEAKWKRKSARFAVECKALSTPKFFQNSINYLKLLPLPKNISPMLFMITAPSQKYFSNAFYAVFK
jgi:hypothetical protein